MALRRVIPGAEAPVDASPGLIEGLVDIRVASWNGRDTA
jgi:hypothetical protein